MCTLFLSLWSITSCGTFEPGLSVGSVPGFGAQCKVIKTFIPKIKILCQEFSKSWWQSRAVRNQKIFIYDWVNLKNNLKISSSWLFSFSVSKVDFKFWFRKRFFKKRIFRCLPMPGQSVGSVPTRGNNNNALMLSSMRLFAYRNRLEKINCSRIWFRLRSRQISCPQISHEKKVNQYNMTVVAFWHTYRWYSVQLRLQLKKQLRIIFYRAFWHSSIPHPSLNQSSCLAFF